MERGKSFELTGAAYSSYIIKYETSLSVPEHRYIEAIQRMERAGYRLEAVGGLLRVKPSEKLTATQRDWLRSHKAELLEALAARSDPHVAEMVATFGATVVANPDPNSEAFVWVTPSRVNQSVEPPHTVYERPANGRRRCLDCRHGRRSLPGDELASVRLCTVGGGGYFAFQLHHCELWEA
jgi:hypothetical protein